MKEWNCYEIDVTCKIWRDNYYRNGTPLRMFANAKVIAVMQRYISLSSLKSFQRVNISRRTKRRKESERSSNRIQNHRRIFPTCKSFLFLRWTSTWNITPTKLLQRVSFRDTLYLRKFLFQIKWFFFLKKSQRFFRRRIYRKHSIENYELGYVGSTGQSIGGETAERSRSHVECSTFLVFLFDPCV